MAFASQFYGHSLRRNGENHTSKLNKKKEEKEILKQQQFQQHNQTKPTNNDMHSHKVKKSNILMADNAKTD